MMMMMTMKSLLKALFKVITNNNYEWNTINCYLFKLVKQKNWCVCVLCGMKGGSVFHW